MKQVVVRPFHRQGSGRLSSESQGTSPSPTDSAIFPVTCCLAIRPLLHCLVSIIHKRCLWNELAHVRLFVSPN